ncbi:MAG: DUF2088 domain-containing protein [Verrucomicrobiota bacterium]
MNYYRVRQHFPASTLDNVAGAVRAALTALSIQGGKRIAIAVGSRGIANLPIIVNTVVAWVRAQGAEPFIVPAMGSHAGATADGQRKLLEGLGITGLPIVSAMDVVEIGPGAFMDKAASEAAGVIVINRIKPHTSFHGRYESGLMKMIAVGLGKQAGAAAIHRLGIPGLREEMPAVARQVLATGKILFGIAILENARDETLAVRVIPAARIPEEEPALLELARANMPLLPVDDVDLLIVDEIGKAISGTGMDTNVIGRLRIAGEPEPVSPRIHRIFVRDVAGESAYGIGLADLTTRRLVSKTNWEITQTNVETSGFTLRGVIPQIVESDDAAVTGRRIVRIKNTLQLETLIVSEPVRKEIEGRVTVKVLGPANLWDAL